MARCQRALNNLNLHLTLLIVYSVAIVALGLPLIDVMDLEAVAKEAAARRRWEFLVTFAPVPVLGGTGFPVNPIATF